MAPRIAILNCYDTAKTLFNFSGRNVGEAELLSARIESFGNVETENFNACFGEFPVSEKEFDACIISGSYYNPDRNSITRYAWMRNLLSFIRRMHENGIPQLGICFGHQMIAVAFGAKAFELAEFESGFKKIMVNGKFKTPIFGGVPGEFYGAFFHKWAIYKSSLPFGSKLLATSPDIPDQAPAFCKGETTFAVQFHPERVARDVKVMLEAHPEMFGNKKPGHLRSADANVRVLRNFVSWVAKRK